MVITSEYEVVQFMWDYLQYILIGQHGIGCKQTWYTKINPMIYNRPIILFLFLVGYSGIDDYPNTLSPWPT